MLSMLALQRSKGGKTILRVPRDQYASRTLYTGVTSDLSRRLAEHQAKALGGFTARYNIGQLVYFEETADVREAIAREKQIKRWSRRKKVTLIEAFNPS